MTIKGNSLYVVQNNAQKSKQSALPTPVSRIDRPSRRRDHATFPRPDHVRVREITIYTRGKGNMKRPLLLRDSQPKIATSAYHMTPRLDKLRSYQSA